jgi:hypothetical protein
MVSCVDDTVVIAVAGLLTTLAASLLPVLISARNERKAWRRDSRAAVYADALAYIQVGYQLYERMLYPEYGNGRPPELQHQDLITARMRLLAPPKTFDKWIAFRDSYDALTFYANENFPGDPLEVLIKADDPLAVRFAASVEEVNTAIRDSLDR